MGGDNINPKFSTVVCHILFVGFVLFAFLCLGLLVYTLLAMAGFYESPLGELSEACKMFAGIVVSIAIVLWSGKQIEVIALGKKTERNIWLTLIAGFLVAAVGYVETKPTEAVVSNAAAEAPMLK